MIVLLLSAIILGGLFLVVPIVINWYLNQNAEKIVSDMITRTNDFVGHDVHFGEIEFDYDYRGTYLHLKEVDIFPSEEITGKEMIRFHLNFDEASLTGFRWIDFLFRNSIRLDSAYLENVFLESITPPFEDLSEPQEQQLAKEGEDYNSISVGNIKLNGLSFENKDSYTDSVRLSITDLFVFADEFVLTKEDINNPNAIFAVDKIEGYMDEAVFHVNEYRNAVSAKDLAFNTTDERLTIERVAFENKLDKYEYIRQFEKETNWMELISGKVRLDGMDFQAYFRQGHIVADSLLLENFDLEVFRDKRRVEDTTRRPKMIHEILHDLPKKINIGAVVFDDVYVSYEERPDTEALRAGKIYFDQVRGRISGFTNFPELLAENDQMEIDAQGNLMGEGAIDLKVTYFLNDESGRFLMNGKIGSMTLQPLNDMIAPATRVALKNGKLNDLFFNIEADGIRGSGEVIVKFQDLEIEILDKNYENNQNILRRIGAFLANQLVIPSQNPSKEGNLKKGKVDFLREKHKFIFNYWWGLVLSGLKSTVIGEKEAQMLEKAGS